MLEREEGRGMQWKLEMEIWAAEGKRDRERQREHPHIAPSKVP